MKVEREFYVGYQKQAPAALAQFLRWTVALVLLIASALALTLITIQERFDSGAFEYGVVKNFEGVIRERPHPMLVVDLAVGSGAGTGEETSTFLLVALGKHGADSEVAGLNGQSVRLQGSLIHREGQMMIEVVSGSVEREVGSVSVPLREPSSLGRQILRGEIVDSKCFFGVMKPGRGKSHRACATRCISGGIPPVLRVETQSGNFRHYLLVDESGAAVNDRVLDLVAEPVVVTGEVLRRDNLWYLEADPSTYDRI